MGENFFDTSDPIKLGKVFPTRHPHAKNKDGSSSNVLLEGFNLDGKERVLPTMVDGKKLSSDEAVNLAYKKGLDNYPSFNSVREASDWASGNHGKIDEGGWLARDDVPEKRITDAARMDEERAARAAFEDEHLEEITMNMVRRYVRGGA